MMTKPLKYFWYMAGKVFFAFPLVFFLLGIFPNTETTASEYEEKAEFIYNFAKFVRWPQKENPDEPLKICILGSDPFGAALKNLENRKVRGRPLSFCVCPEGKEMEDCHIVFVSASEKERFAAILPRLGSLPVLTVGDIPGFAADGGIINLIHTGSQLCFEINTDAVQRSGLQISSQLLKLGRSVGVRSEKKDVSQ